MTPSKAQQIASSAKEKAQIAWTSLRSMTFEDGDAARNAIQQRLKKVIEVDPKAENAWDSMVKAMFGSCTNGIPEDTISPRTLTGTRSFKSFESSDPKSPSREKEEYFYSQFMSKDRNKGQNVVSSAQSQDKKATLPSKGTAVPKPFHMSSPARKEERVPPILVREIIQKRETPVISNGISFDDGISAISAQTLEELVREEEVRRGILHGVQSHGAMRQNQSKDSTHFSHSDTSPRNIEEEKSDDLGNPITFSRGKRSSGTHSTRSSQTSEFENTWRRDEHKYWKDITEREGNEVRDASETNRLSKGQQTAYMAGRVKDIYRSRSKEDAIKDLPHVATQTTASSSYYSASPFAKSHPHETFPYEASDVLRTAQNDEIISHRIVHNGFGRRDPDRLQQVLVLTHDTELAEI